MALKETDWEAIAHELLLMLSEHDTGANPLPRLIDQHSKKPCVKDDNPAAQQ